MVVLKLINTRFTTNTTITNTTRWISTKYIWWRFSKVVGQVNEIFKSNKKSKAFPFKNSNFRSRGRLVEEASPEVDRFTIKLADLESSAETPDGKFGSSLIGATLKIKSPKVDPVKFPADKFIIPDEFETRIKV